MLSWQRHGVALPICELGNFPLWGNFLTEAAFSFRRRDGSRRGTSLTEGLSIPEGQKESHSNIKRAPRMHRIRGALPISNVNVRLSPQPAFFIAVTKCRQLFYIGVL